MNEPTPIPIPAHTASQEANSHSNRIDAFVSLQLIDFQVGGRCRWHHSKAVSLSDRKRAAVAWIIADAVMESRGGNSDVRIKWSTAVENGIKLSGSDAKVVEAFVEDVFGLPGKKTSDANHLVGHVGEWLWYLHMKELPETHRKILHIEEPTFDVTDTGGDGLIFYESTADQTTTFRLWETKKLTAARSTPVSQATYKAYRQLDERAHRYLAKLTKPYSTQPGRIGALGSEMVELWVNSDERVGVGVGVATDRLPPMSQCFTTMGNYFPDLAEAGQLEGLLVTVEELWELAVTVREYLWTAL